jgi:uncharacterized phage protein (TIGR01671 family)
VWRREPMKRIILFRGQKVENSEWVYGFHYAFPPICRIRHWLNLFNHYGDVDVIPETVGQYTGLQDKNGTDIYEGDILQFEDTDSESVDVGLGRDCMCKVSETAVVNWAEVVLQNGCFGLDIKGSELYENRFIDFNELIQDWDEDFFKNAEIIGNIWDNRELL